MTGSDTSLPKGAVQAGRTTVVRADWPNGAWLAGFIAVLLAVPLRLPIPGFERLGVFGQAVAVATILLILPQLAVDTVQRRRGSGLRVLVLLMAATATVAWAVVAARRGFTVGSFLSWLNWVALGGLVIGGQVLFARLPRLERAMDIWALIHALIAAVVVVYVLSTFGSDLFLSQERGPFQVAVQGFLPAWPNYFAIAMAVAVCVLYGRILAGKGSLSTWLQLAALGGGLLVSLSRSGWLVCLAALLVMTVVSGRLGRALPILLGAVVVAVLLASQIPVIRFQVQATFTPGTSQSITLLRRVAFAVEALHIWRRDPLVGIGFARFDEYATLSDLTRISPVGARGVEELGSVHNEYLSTLLKSGLLGTFGFLAFLIGATRTLRRLAADHHDVSGARWLAIAALGITTALAVAGLGAESFRTLSCSALYWIVVGGLSALPASPQRHLP